MISHFWNLCRACPAMDVDKLHSEYRSTYRWHEYTPKQNQVVRKPPAPSGSSSATHMAANPPTSHNMAAADGVDFPRKKKHPDVAYRSHELFDVNGVAGGKEANTRVPRPTTRHNVSFQRRSQSEGPITRNPLFQSEYRLQFHVNPGSKRTKADDPPDTQQESRGQVSYPPPAPSSGWNKKQNSLRSKQMNEAAREPKKSISMGQIKGEENKDVEDINGNIEGMEKSDVSMSAVSSPSAKKRKEYKSEYNNRFRPFSQYEYAGEGKFVNTSGSPPSELDGPTLHLKRDKIENLQGEPWYQEVIELRKQANDYKCRGWGTDLVPPHMNQLYNQQIQLYEQASTRETLSALSLAITTPRSISKDEKDKENLRKSSPLKPRSSRPRTAPVKGNKKASSRSESAQPTLTTSSPTAKDSKGDQADGKTSAGRSVSVGIPQRPEPAWKVHLDSSKQRDSSSKRQRPNSEARDKVGESAKRGISRSSSKAASRDHSRPPSAIENHLDYFKEPVVKSPPEPTRVKSPEQLMMRSPDPINWTVPLDTGKTFSVTQSVRDGDSARNSPMSDHSSHFDSVSGTAINLGVHTMNAGGALHYPKVSALAREAKELQPKSKKEEKPQPSSEGGASTTVSKPEPVTEPSPSTGGQEPTTSSSGYVTHNVTNGTNGTNGTASHQPDPASNLKCLEDPTFSFDEPPPSTTTTTSSAAPPPSDIKSEAVAAPKKPSYRVLEDPFEAVVPPPKPKGSPYKVLEDPTMMTQSIYEPASGSQPKQDCAKGRPEEIQDGAREQFDTFFNKGKDSTVTQ